MQGAPPYRVPGFGGMPPPRYDADPPFQTPGMGQPPQFGGQPPQFNPYPTFNNPQRPPMYGNPPLNNIYAMQQMYGGGGY
jgi:hypothetical protein